MSDLDIGQLKGRPPAGLKHRGDHLANDVLKLHELNP